MLQTIHVFSLRRPSPKPTRQPRERWYLKFSFIPFQSSALYFFQRYIHFVIYGEMGRVDMPRWYIVFSVVFPFHFRSFVRSSAKPIPSLFLPLCPSANVWVACSCLSIFPFLAHLLSFLSLSGRNVSPTGASPFEYQTVSLAREAV